MGRDTEVLRLRKCSAKRKGGLPLKNSRWPPFLSNSHNVCFVCLLSFDLSGLVKLARDIKSPPVQLSGSLDYTSLSTMARCSPQRGRATVSKRKRPVKIQDGNHFSRWLPFLSYVHCHCFQIVIPNICHKLSVKATFWIGWPIKNSRWPSFW